MSTSAAAVSLVVGDVNDESVADVSAEHKTMHWACNQQLFFFLSFFSLFLAKSTQQDPVVILILTVH